VISAFVVSAVKILTRKRIKDPALRIETVAARLSFHRDEAAKLPAERDRFTP